MHHFFGIISYGRVEEWVLFALHLVPVQLQIAGPLGMPFECLGYACGSEDSITPWGVSPRWTQEARRAEGDAPGRRRRGFQPLGFNCESCDSAMHYALENKLWLHRLHIKLQDLWNTVSFGLDIGNNPLFLEVWTGTALISWNPFLFSPVLTRFGFAQLMLIQKRLWNASSLPKSLGGRLQPQCHALKLEIKKHHVLSSMKSAMR